ncbi:MAG: hypothetical protein GY721_01415 [Deltaproteobacteria bacterium]|nr:hypothetical protein [Deltaproteobacteria bacterium]
MAKRVLQRKRRVTLGMKQGRRSVMSLPLKRTNSPLQRGRLARHLLSIGKKATSTSRLREVKGGAPHRQRPVSRIHRS